MSNSSSDEQKIPQAARRLRWTALATLLCGAAFSIFFWRSRSEYERRELKSALAVETDSLSASVQREVETFAGVLASIRQLHTLSAHITDDDFREFVTKGLGHQTAILHAFGFAQNIPANQRSRAEGAANDPRALHIVEPDGKGSFRKAGNREQFFPVTYQFPDDGLGVPNGFDLAGDAQVMEALGRMSLAGGLAICGPGFGPDHSDYLAMAPIIYVVTGADGKPAGGFLSGAAAGLFRPPSILAPALKLAESRGLKLSLVNRPAGAEKTGEEEFLDERPVEVLGQVWKLRCTAGPKFTNQYLTAQPVLLLAGGIAISGLLALQLLMLGRRAATIENEVRDRTAALRTANAALETSMTERRRLEQEVLDISTQEKQRVGRDLHDSLGQKLSGATYLSRALAEELAEAAAPQREKAAKINEVLKEAIAQSRRIARGLSPVDLSEGGLAEALAHFAKETSEVYGISCTFNGETALHLPPGMAAANLYQIAQEAVNNAIRHGKASEITILLERMPDDGQKSEVRDQRSEIRDQRPEISNLKSQISNPAGELVIEDNGSGLPPDATQSGGMGLRIMRYRAGLVGGELKIERGRDGGTTVVCRFPV